MKLNSYKGAALATILAGATLSSPLMAQDTCAYPEKPVSIVVGYSPGGGTDTVARILANELSQMGSGQPFNVVNQPGGAQVVAMKSVMEAEKDGYTIQFFSAGSATLSLLLRDQGFSFLDEFQPIGNVAISTSVVAVNSDSPVQTGQDLIDLIKSSFESGTKLRYAHAGRGSASHIAVAAWLDANGVYDMVQDVPFEGSGPSRAAVIGNQVDFGGMAVSNVDRMEELRGIGVLADVRDPGVPYVATMKEQGVPYVDMDGPLLLAVPTGTPDEVTTCLEGMLKEVAAKESFVTDMQKVGYAVVYKDAPTVTEQLVKQTAEWKIVVDKIIATATSK